MFSPIEYQVFISSLVMHLQLLPSLFFSYKFIITGTISFYHFNGTGFIV